MLKLKKVLSLVLCAVTLLGIVVMAAPSASAATVNSNGVMVFSKKADGDTYISKNFKVKEFACKDGSDTILIDPELVVILQNIRDHFGKTVTINSAYRTTSYNKRIKGAKDSYHVKGMAADIRVKGVSAKEVAAYAETIGVRGIGLYGNFVHVDTRAKKTYWYGEAQKKRTTFGGKFNTQPYGETIIDVSVPSSVQSGKKLNISGHVISSSNILTCNAQLIGVDGKTKTLVTYIPQGKYCLLTYSAKVNPGVYTFRMTVKTSDGSETWEQQLVVEGNKKTSGLTINGKVASSFKKGKTPTLSGSIATSLFKKVKRVQVVVLDSNGKVVQSKTSTPKARSVKMQTVAKNIQFNKLAAGKYTLVIAAYDSVGRVSCSTQSFTVK